MLSANFITLFALYSRTIVIYVIKLNLHKFNIGIFS